MSHTEEQVQELLHEMYMTAESSDWDLEPEEIRSQRVRHAVALPDVKVLVLVAAAVILVVVGVVVANGSPSHRSTAAGPSPTTTLPPGTTVTVPNAENQSLSTATEALKHAGLNVDTNYVANNAPSQTVLNQVPTAGSQVGSGSAVTLTVSSGPSNVRVPNLVGLNQVQAGTVLGESGLNIGNIISIVSSDFAAGIVTSSSPTTGTSVVPGSSVDLVISTGPPPPSG
jgi:serine/threonine-protein kinase